MSVSMGGTVKGRRENAQYDAKEVEMRNGRMPIVLRIWEKLQNF